MIHRARRSWLAAALWVAAWPWSGAGAAPGDVIENTAYVTSDGGVTFATNTASFTVTTRRTPSTITFLSIAPGRDCTPHVVAPT